MARTLGDDLRDFKAGKIKDKHHVYNPNKYYYKDSGIDYSDNLYNSDSGINNVSKPINDTPKKGNQITTESDPVTVPTRQQFEQQSVKQLFDNNMMSSKFQKMMSDPYGEVRRIAQEQGKATDKKTYILDVDKSGGLPDGTDIGVYATTMMANAPGVSKFTTRSQRIAEYEEKYKDYDYTQITKELSNIDDNSNNNEIINYLKAKRDEIATSQDLQNEIEALDKEYGELTPFVEKDDIRRSEIEKEWETLEALKQKKEYEENEKKYYYDIVQNDVKAATIIQKYYELNEFNKDSASYKTANPDEAVKYPEYGEKTNDERAKIEQDFLQLSNKGYDTEKLLKYYTRIREREDNLKSLEYMKEQAEKHPIIMSVGSVPLNTFGAVGDAVKYVGAGIDSAMGGDGYIDPNSTNVAKAQTVRETVSKDMSGVGKFLYDTGMSITDFMSLLPLNVVPGGQAASLAIMGTSAGVSSANQVIENGGDIKHAVFTGICAGTAEAFFEKFSLDALIKLKQSGKTAIVEALIKNGLIEGSEEGATEIANAISDYVINGDLSQYGSLYNKYLSMGYSQADARKMCAVEFGKQFGLSVAGGTLSGGVLGGGTSVVNYTGNQISSSKLGKELSENDDFDLEYLIESAKKLGKDSKASKLAQKIEKMSVHKITDTDIGNLWKLTTSEANAKAKADAETETQPYSATLEKIAPVNQSSTVAATSTTQTNVPDTTISNTETVNTTLPAVNVQQSNISETKSQQKNLTLPENELYPFGKNHKNGISVKNNSGETLNIVSVESSAKNFGEADNTVILRTSDGQLVNADDVIPHNTDFQQLLNYAKNFDSNGAKRLLSQYESYAENAKENGRTPDVAEYVKVFEELYNIGKIGVEYESVVKSGNYSKAIDTLGVGIARTAVTVGNADINTIRMNEANKLQRVRIPGENNIINSKVKVEFGSEKDAENITAEQKQLLQAVAVKAGRDIVLTNRLGDNENGKFQDGKIYINANLNESYILPVALHEATHGIRIDNPLEYQGLCEFITNYLVENGENIDYLLNDIKIKWEDRTSTREDLLEELVCQTVMAIATDEVATRKAIECNENKNVLEKALNALRYIVKRAYAFIKGINTSKHNLQAQPWIDDLNAIAKLADKLSTALDNTKSLNTQSQTTENTEQKNNTPEGAKYSMAGDIALTANKSKLEEAKKLESLGVSSEVIRQKTDWFRGYDNKWRFEIDDSKSELIENPNLEKHESEDGDIYFTGKLSDVLNHSDLYEAYPQLKDINIVIQQTEIGVRGISQPNYIILSLELFKRHTKEYEYILNNAADEIRQIEKTPEYKEYHKWYEDEELSEKLSPEKWLEEEKKARDKFFSSEIGKRYYFLNWGRKNVKTFEFGWDKAARTVLMHEIQHAIQKIEGFARGSDDAYFKNNPSKKYNTLAYKKYIEAEKNLKDIMSRTDEDVTNILQTYDMETTYIGLSSREYAQAYDKAAEKIKDEDLLEAFFDYAEARGNAYKELVYKENETPNQSYQKTAGEIEARDVSSRLNLTSEQRKNIRPDIDRMDVVFAEDALKYHAQYNKPDYDFRKALTKEEKLRFDKALLNNSRGLLIGDNGVLLVDYQNTDNYKLICYNGNKLFPVITNVYKIEGFDYNINNSRRHIIDLIVQLEKGNIDGKTDTETAGAILQNFPLRSGEVFKIYNKKTRRYNTISGRKSGNNEQNRTDSGFESDRTGIFENTEQGISTAQLSNESDIHFAIDDTITEGFFSDDGDLFTDDGDIRDDILENAIQLDPSNTVSKLYNHSAKSVEIRLQEHKDIELDDKAYLKIAHKLMNDYKISRKENPDFDIELAEKIKNLSKRIENGKHSNFLSVFDEVLEECKGALLRSNELDNTYMQEEREQIFDYLRGKTLLVTEYAESDVRENYGSVRNYKNRIFGKVNVALERNSKARKQLYMDDFISFVEENFPYLITDEADSVQGFKWLDNLINGVLQPRYENHYLDGYYENIDTATIEMAFAMMENVIDSKARQAILDKKLEKRKVREITKARKQAIAEREALKNAKIADYRKRYQKEHDHRVTQIKHMRENQLKEKEHNRKVKKSLNERIKMLEEANQNQKKIINSGFNSIREEYIEGRTKTIYLERLGRMLDRMTKKLDGKANNTEYIPEVLKRPILNVLSSFTADPGNYKNGNKKQLPGYFGEWKNISEIGSRINELALAYGDLRPQKTKLETNGGKDKIEYSYIDVNSLAFQEGTLKVLEQLSNQVKGKNIYQLEANDIKAIYDTMIELEDSLREAVEIILDGQRVSIMEAAQRGIIETESVNFKKDVQIFDNTALNVLSSSGRELRNKYIATHLDPVRYGRFLSGYHEDYVIYKLMSELHEGDKKRIRIMQSAFLKVQSVTMKYKNSELKALQSADVKDFDFKDIKTGKHVKISQGMLLAVYLTDRQADGHRHLVNEEYNHYTLIPDLDSMNLGRNATGDKAHRVRLSKNDLGQIKEYIENNKMLSEIASAISEVYNTILSEHINEVSMAKYGKRIATVQNYYPIKIDPNAPRYNPNEEPPNIFIDMRMKSRGFTKNRTNSTLAIVISDVFQTFTSSVKEVSEYCGLLIPIENFRKVYNSSNGDVTFHSAIVNKFGQTAEHYIEKLMADLQQAPDWLDKSFLNKAQGNFMGAKLLFNPGSAVKQLAAFPTAYKYFGVANVTRAAAEGMFKIDFEKYAEYTPYLWYRKEGNGTVIGELSREMGFTRKLRDRIDFMGKMDRYVVGCLLYAAELHVEQTTDLKPGTDAFYKEVTRQYEKCVDETQPNNMITSKPQYIRNNIMRILSLNAFRSQNMAIANGVIDSFMEYAARRSDYKLNKNEETKSAKNKAALNFIQSCVGATASAMLIGALTIFVNLLIWHKWDDFKDEEGKVTFDTLKNNFIDYTLESFLGTFVWMDKIYEAIKSGIENNNFFGLAVMSLENINNAVKKFNQGDYLSLAALIVDCCGYPGENLLRIARSVSSYGNDLINGRGDIISANNSYGENNTDYFNYIILRAKQNGDIEKAEHFEEMWKDDLINKQGKTDKEATDIIKSKIVTALATSDEDIEAAALAKANGDLQTYENLLNKVIGYGFDSKDVKKAVDKVIKNIITGIKDRNITEKDDVISDLKEQGFNDKGAEYVYEEMQKNTENKNQSKTSAFADTSKGNGVAYSYQDLFDALVDGNTENSDRIYDYLVNECGKEDKDIRSALRSASRTDPLWKEYIEVSAGNNSARTRELKDILTRIYGSWSTATTYLHKYQKRMKEKEEKNN